MTTLKLPAAAPAPTRWQRALPLVLAVAGLLWLLRDTAAAMVGIWSRSDTFAHAFLVPPISLALAWRRRAELARVALSPSPAWLLPLVSFALLWLLGELAGVHAAAQAALVAMVVCAVPAVLGTRLARVVAFPLLFLLFSVPVGEFLIQPMMEATADFTVAALRLSGIPVYREGLQFVIPSGNWSVVAACSGVRYLIASLMVGTLFAYLNFRSMKRRLAFVAVAIVVPIVANWLRAYLIVLVGHLSSNQFAAGADHLIYGWIFFGVVILLMFMVGSRFADAARTTPDGLTGSVAEAAPAPAPRPWAPWAAAVTVVLAVAATQAVHDQIDEPRAPSAAGVPTLSLPAELAAAGQPNVWAATTRPLTTWAPAYPHAAASVTTLYQVAGARNDEAVGVWVGLYRDQGYERKMITSTNRLVDEGSTRWLALAQVAAQVPLALGEGTVGVFATTLRSPADPNAEPTQRLLVWRVYRVAGRYVTGDAQALVWLALQRLTGRGDDSTVFLLYTPLADDGRAAERLRRFTSAHLATLVARIEAAAAAVPARP